MVGFIFGSWKRGWLFDFTESRAVQSHVVERGVVVPLLLQIKRLREMRETFFDPRTKR